MAAIENSTGKCTPSDIVALREHAYKLYKGDGIEKDNREAYKLFHQAADQGDTNSMFWLGAICENEDEYKSPQEGFEWFLKAAKMGNIAAQFQIGYHYLHGVYVKQDYFQAFKWFMISAVRGYPHSQNSVGTMYLRGQVKLDELGEWIDENRHSDNEIEIDQEKCQRSGYRWLMKSAKQNHPSGLYNLAGMYLYGVYVDKDEEMAISMYCVANEIGGTGTRALDMLNKLGAEISVQQADYERLDHLFEDINEADMSDNVPDDMLNYIIGTQKLAFPEMTKNDELQLMSAVTDEYKREQSRERYYLYDGKYVVKRDPTCEVFYRLESRDGVKCWCIIPYMIDSYLDDLSVFEEIDDDAARTILDSEVLGQNDIYTIKEHD